MDDTALLKLPFIMPSQAQKHVTHNEALLRLDALVQLSVKSRALSEPPSAVAEGARYIVAAGASGLWEGRAGQVAAFQDGIWVFYEPQPGWQAVIEDEASVAIWLDGMWQITSGGNGEQVARLGIGTAPDDTNRFSAKLNNALFAAAESGEGESGDLRLVMNKEGAGNVLSLIFQSGWSARAEFGLAGSDDLIFKTSADGVSFRDALVLRAADAVVDQPNLPRFKAFTNYDNYAALDSWTTIGINNADYNDQSVFDAGTGLFTAPADGTYFLGANLLFKVNASLDARMRARFLLNDVAPVRGSTQSLTGAHVSEQTTLRIEAFASLSTGDTVALQGGFTGADGYFAADETCFWGMKIG
ncbi:DUF2793 domain-containing protein [Nitratireductor basaltis]|uniref:C1q domain-containing protein n=1 Tax=Nitratireductor basaltis TaxID=472175 RepID=A0A084UCN3_9HYPH|nr:DUF2793 domain-containing protein [Nitratireductor basaltis]KFB10719.1 hypothetical protein EL18_01758 [Nitratireductor basaltis]